MKTNEYKIEEIHRLLSNDTLTGVILAENNPEFLDKNQTTIVNDKYTWYAYTRAYPKFCVNGIISQSSCLQKV